MMLPKWVARKPARNEARYLKYGFVPMAFQGFVCPRCGNGLNAGPGHQPNYCDRCGQKLDFKGIGWGPGMEERAEGRGDWREQVEDRVV